MSKEIIEVLDALSDRLGMSIDWTQNNIIPYLQEISSKYVNYEIATSIVWIVVGVLFLVAAIWAVKKVIEVNNDTSIDEDVTALLVCVLVVLAVALSATGIITILEQVFDIITCYTFPEKIIIEKLIEIKKNMN